ncbi:5'-3' exoribonuclease 1 isoform X2 [Planococcus citri]|uniref:5'-3' exoribonuclease 1 isoform X2 n=1 Tax=Planococcus citri TaxID=170843 RepID=UPI0031F9B9E8
MGVPKFFRYISERYPCLSQLILESDIPEFDNLYLDMNGIIHNCSHPNDYDPHFRITEEKIFKDIFHYIEVLFRIIRPQKLFFMAIDGVAPRAKMNQQRGRRFRSAKEAADREKEVMKKGEKLPEADRFDSNCITPGTPFMARLQAQLRYFVTSKMSTDKMWQKVKVILSGHECPGEGEHKIMDYIRYLRAQPDHDPNTRHCLYGLDADLIMLGLCSHEPHFALLREEVKFGSRNQSKKIVAPEDTKFFLLHLSLMREYLEMEFSDVKATLPFDFNLESIIDDWVLMGFLVGNDFIPNLPELHIASGALPVLYRAYKEVLPTLDGYLNESGTLNLARFEAYMRKLGSFDIKQFREKYEDIRYMERKTGQTEGDAESTPANNINYRRPLQPFFGSAEGEGEDKEDGEAQEIVEEPLESCDDKAIQNMMEMEEDEGSDYYDEEERDKDRLAFFQEFHLHKRNYYQEKLEYEHVTPEVLRGQAEGYITALQWNLNYYYNGICSWSWYYPHHYSPYISDIQNFKDMKIEFDSGRPFLPFEQLLAVLPALSKSLLPKPFQELMTDVRSPIFDYYPCDFETDLNGKKNDWEAVVLIPFIEEKKLLAAMATCSDRLTDEEKERNSHGPMHVYTYSEENLGRYEAPAYFNAIEKNHAVDTPLHRDDIAVPREKLRKGLLPGVLLDVFFPGFPTFKHLKYTHILEPKGVKIFQSPSQGMNMIVKPVKEQETPPLDILIKEFLNKVIHVSWPYLNEAKVVGIYTKEEKCWVEAGQMKKEPLNADQQNAFKKGSEALKHEFLKSKGIDIGNEVDLVFSVRLKEGQKFVFSSFSSGNKISLEKKWSNKTQSFPIQVIVKELKTKTVDPSGLTLDDIFPVGCSCFVLNKSFYGCLGLVSAPSEDWLINIRVTAPPEPKPNELRIKPTNIRYYNNGETAYRAKVPNYLVARITGTIFVLDTDDPKDADKCPRVNIGLNLKFSRRNQHLPGYTKRNENNQWLYSDKTIALIQEYHDAFPDVFRYLSENSDKDNIFKTHLFSLPGQTHMLSVISNWLASKTELKAERRSCDAELLESDVIQNVEYQVDSFMKANKRGRYVNIKSRPSCLYQPSSQIEKDYPDPAEYHLLDRVVNVRDNFVVPLGARGFIIGMEKQADTGLTYCDILFDNSFSSAVQYHTKKKRVYKLPDRCLLNITYAKRKHEKEELKKAQPKIPMMQPNSMPHPMFPPPLMAQKVDVPMQGPGLAYNVGPIPRQIMIAGSGQPMSYSNAVTDRKIIPQKIGQFRAIENNNVDVRQRPPKTDSPIKTRIIENSKLAGGVEEEKISETTLALKKMLRINDASNDKSAGSKNAEDKKTDHNAEELGQGCYGYKRTRVFSRSKPHHITPTTPYRHFFYYR